MCVYIFVYGEKKMATGLIGICLVSGLKVGNWFIKPLRRGLVDPNVQLLERGFKGYLFYNLLMILFFIAFNVILLQP